MLRKRKSSMTLALAVILCTVTLLPVTALAATGFTLTITYNLVNPGSGNTYNATDTKLILLDKSRGKPVSAYNNMNITGKQSLSITGLDSGTNYYVMVYTMFYGNDGVPRYGTSEIQTVTTTGDYTGSISNNPGYSSDPWYSGSGGSSSGWHDHRPSDYWDGRWNSGWHDGGYYSDSRAHAYSVTAQTASYAGNGNAAFTVSANYNNFTGVSVSNTSLIKGKHYRVESSGYGSLTHVTIFDSYLQTLNNGTYEVYFSFANNGYASAVLTIARPTAALPSQPVITAPGVPGAVAPVVGAGNYIVSVSSNLNVRSAPNAYGAKLGSLANGTRITVGQVTAGWGNINYGGASGWVSMAYLRSAGIY